MLAKLAATLVIDLAFPVGAIAKLDKFSNGLQQFHKTSFRYTAAQGFYYPGSSSYVPAKLCLRGQSIAGNPIAKTTIAAYLPLDHSIYVKALEPCIYCLEINHFHWHSGSIL